MRPHLFAAALALACADGSSGTGPISITGSDEDGDGIPWPYDCDDGDPTVAPGLDDEHGDQLDTDCDGVDGVAILMDTSHSYGEDVPVLARRVGWALAATDLDGDGIIEIAIGSSEQDAATLAGSEGSLAILTGPNLEPIERWEGDDVDTNWLATHVVAGSVDDRPSFLAVGAKRHITVAAPLGSPHVNAVATERTCPVAIGDLTGDGIDDLLHRCADLNVGVQIGPLASDDAPYIGLALPTDVPAEQLAIADVTGDGQPDAIIAEPNVDGFDLAGRVTVYAGPIGSSNPDPWSTLQGDRGARLGSSLAGASDLDGDGIPELLVGSMGHPADDRNGRLLALEPGDTLDEPTLDVLGAEGALRDLGRSSAVGDFDGDGFQDLAVGAPGSVYEDVWQPGVVHVFFGPISGRLAADEADLHFRGTEPGQLAGLSLLAAETSGDGIDDLIVGAPGASGTQGTETVNAAGRVYLLESPFR